MVPRENSKNVALTFDDGPHPLYTPKILDILKAYHIQAHFFIVGSRIHGNEKLIKRMYDEGHKIGNHGYSHSPLTEIRIDQYVWEVWRTGLMLWSITGEYPDFFRFPYGKFDNRIRYFHSGPLIGWNVDIYDWSGGTPKNMARNILRQTTTGSIILLHDIRKSTLDGLPTILESLKQNRIQFETLSGSLK
jgi:peptidoglycan/xylan/chitin deacetylase (PgdA/CDA1 family)